MIDKNENSEEFTIKNKKTDKNPNLVFVVPYDKNPDLDLVKVLRLKPTEKKDSKKPYDIKFKIHVCTDLTTQPGGVNSTSKPKESM